MDVITNKQKFFTIRFSSFENIVYYKDVITFIPNNFRGKIRMPFQFYKLQNKDGIPDYNTL